MRQLNNRSTKEIQKQKLIEEIINQNNYVPRQQTIKSTLIEDSDFNKYAYGVSNKIDPTFFIDDELLNSEKFSNTFKTVIEDLEYIRSNYKTIDNQIEDDYRNYINKSNRYLDQLNKYELEINKEVLLSNSTDPFIYGIIEEFTDLKFIDKELTDALIYDGRVMCKSNIFESQTVSNFNIKADIVSRSNSIVFKTGMQNLYDLKKLDKAGYQHICYSNNKNDIVDLILDLDLMEFRDINVLRIDLLDLGINSKMIINVFVLNESNTYEPVEENNSFVISGTTFINVNKKNIRYIKIVLTKTSYDNEENLEYLFKFNIDYIGFNKFEFDNKNPTTLICGPYKILDENNNPVSFNMASIKKGTCCVIPEKTSIDFYLSKDKANWEQVSFNSSGREVVTFENTNPSIVSLIDLSLGNYIMNDREVLNNYKINLSLNQSILNFYIPTEKLSNYNENSEEIYRQTFLSTNDGWIKIYDDTWFTTFEVDELEGRYINLGNTTAIIDNGTKSGKVFLSYGRHTITTKNYKVIANNDQIKNETDFKIIDSDYPYNHKYLVEGFRYASDFVGQRRYLGFGRNYGYLLKYVPLGYLKSNPNAYDIYSKVVVDNLGLCFVVNSNPNNNDFSNESYDINVLSSSNEFDNNLYIKAILKTNDSAVSPKIDSIQVRVI